MNKRNETVSLGDIAVVSTHQFTTPWKVPITGMGESGMVGGEGWGVWCILGILITFSPLGQDLHHRFFTHYLYDDKKINKLCHWGHLYFIVWMRRMKHIFPSFSITWLFCLMFKILNIKLRYSGIRILLIFSLQSIFVCFFLRLFVHAIKSSKQEYYAKFNNLHP